MSTGETRARTHAAVGAPDARSESVEGEHDRSASSPPQLTRRDTPRIIVKSVQSRRNAGSVTLEPCAIGWNSLSGSLPSSRRAAKKNSSAAPPRST